MFNFYLFCRFSPRELTNLLLFQTSLPSKLPSLKLTPHIECDALDHAVRGWFSHVPPSIRFKMVSLVDARTVCLAVNSLKSALH